MGDNAAGTAKLLLLMLPLRATSANIDPPVITDGDKKPLSDQTITEDTIVSELLALGQEPCQMLRGAIHAFEQKDAHAAYKICQEGELVNERYRLVHNDLTTLLTGKQAIFALQQDPLIALRMTYCFWIAHNLKRVGDHCSHVCRRNFFFLEGKEMANAMETE